MKIIIDKVENPPPHALTRRDVKAVLSVIPKDWDFSLPIVHLKATLPEKTCPVRYDFLKGPKLTICSRGMTPQTVYRDILRELAIEGLRKSTRYGHRLSETELEELDRLIQPFLNQIETAQSEQTPPGRETLRDHYVYRRLESCGYTWKEAYQIVKVIEDERHHPTSRTQANRIHRARQLLLAAGLDPDTMAVATKQKSDSDS